MSASGNAEFSPWRSYLWPVHRHELKKLIPMLLIFFLISFDYNILRTLKDSLLITAKSSGAEVIPFVKVWAMFPGAILMTFLFTWLSNRFSREKVFYIIMSIFLSYFFIFAFILYPLRDIIHPHDVADGLENVLPTGLKGFVAMFRYWTFTIFYVMSELWGSSVLFVLFWGFANQVTKMNEAKRFYGLFGVGANLSGVFAGQMSVCCCFYTSQFSLPFGEDAWHQSLILLISLIVGAGLLTIAIFRWMNIHVLSNHQLYDSKNVKVEEEVKGKLSLKESFAFLLRSRYLLSITLIVISYNVVINLTEVIWKHQVREMYPNPNDYTLYMNEIVSIIGLIATCLSLFVSGHAIRRFGWTFTAMITPAILAGTSLGFFTFFFLKHHFSDLVLPFLGLTPFMLVVFLGSVQNVLSRAAKYSVFDATKEMAFIPLNPESKLVGKAAIDGICSRLGKSGGSVIHQGLLLTFSTLTASAPYVAIILFAILLIWAMTVRLLGNQFASLTAQIERTEPLLEANQGNSKRSITVLSEYRFLQESQAI